MRIVFSSGIFPPDVGGPASYVPAMAAALVNLGHDVEVVCLSDRLDHDDSTYPFPVHRVIRSARKSIRFPRTVSLLRSLARTADVIYANTLSSEAALAGHLARKPVVHKIVGDIAWERARSWGWYDGTIDSYQTSHGSPRLRALTFLRSRPLQSARAIITPSRYLQGIVQRWGIPLERINVVYNAVDMPTCSLPPTLPPHDGSTILTACRLTPWKGVQGLIESLTYIPNARLVVAGDGPMREHLERLAIESRLGDRVVWLGFVTPPHLRALYREADVFVLNSSYEGLPHVVIEAMAAGVAVVATAAGGTPEVVEDGVTGRLVPVADTKALTAAISSLLADPNERAGLAEMAERVVRDRFAFKNMVQSTEAVLKRAAG